MGGLVKGAFNAIKSVAKFGINMVKSVIKNPLPTIATIGLNFIAPGFANFTGLPTWAIKGIGRAAISAASGGSLSSIVAAGVTPYFNSPSFQNALGSIGGGALGEAIKGASKFVNTNLNSVFGDTLGGIFTGALGDSSIAGLVAAVSGDDIVAAMGSELVSSAVTSGIGKAWDSLKTEVPKLLETEAEIKTKYSKVQDSQDFIAQVQRQQDIVNNLADEIRAPSTKYQQLKSEYDTKLAEYNAAAAIEDVATANRIADELNTNIIPKMEELTANYGDFADTYVASNLMPQYEQAKAYLDSLINNNQSLIDDYISTVDEIGQLQKSYELGASKVLAENADFKMTEAIARGDFTEASNFYHDLENFNKGILELDPSAITVTPSINLSSQTLLKDIYSASDETLKNQLISQANLNQQFNDIRTNAPVITPTPPTVPETPTPETPAPTEPTPVEPTIPETPAPVQPTPVTPVVPETPITDDRAPGYADLPTLPEEGIGQPTPSVPTTPTTPSTGTGSNIVDNIIGGAGNILENAVNKVPTVIENALIGGATNAVVNEILGNKPPTTRPTINKPRPPAKVDVGTLRPYTGSVFGETTTTPTTPVGGLPTTPPAKVDPSSLTPYTGSLSFLGQTTTPPTNTTTQTPSGGLQSTQTQTPPTKVDVSRLTPVTDTNLLKSLGIA
jgi:tetratricopeptide (TPR) repeat protein